ncbi:hypothetical protein BDR05DRAFT_966006 [Suillus weaverae]|nr:hypothetical protein BDR05DRAFT_966006 [Suillus weaverae]
MQHYCRSLEVDVVPWYGRHHAVKRLSGIGFQTKVTPVYDPSWNLSAVREPKGFHVKRMACHTKIGP